MAVDISKFLNQEDAIKYIIEEIRWWRTKNYWYDFHLRQTLEKRAWENTLRIGEEKYKIVELASPLFYDALWELCSIWVLRPSIRVFNTQSTDEWSAWNGYAITAFWKTWLSEIDLKKFIPMDPSRFGEMLEPYGKKFGLWFQQRANQAILCYNCHAYLACCVMCGAAAESILLHLAIQKDGNEDNILKKYRAGNGRKTIEDFILHKLKWWATKETGTDEKFAKPEKHHGWQIQRFLNC